VRRSSKAAADEPAGTPFERFDQLVRTVVAVPKSEIDKREAAYKRQRAKKKGAQPKLAR